MIDHKQVSDYQQVIDAILGLEFHPDGAVIREYPIGGGNYGQCRLEVQHHPRRGWRTVRTTTDKKNRWCKPKASTYRAAPIGVVSGELNVDGAESIQEYAWITLDKINGLRVNRANLTFASPLIKLPTVFQPDEGHADREAFDVGLAAMDAVAKIIIERMKFNPEVRYDL